VRKSIALGSEVIGARNGWKGMLEGTFIPLTRESVSGIHSRGGTILGTSRTNPYKKPDGEQKIMDVIAQQGIDVLIPIGGEDTLGVAAKLHQAGIKVIGVPKTIDNDLMGTDFTFGFDTAVNIAMEAIDRIHTTAESHSRVMVVEVMGRHAGWIAFYAGLAGGADILLVPEIPVSIESVCEKITKRHEGGKNFSIVVVSEGAKVETEAGSDADGSFVITSMEKDPFGHIRLGGIGQLLANEIEKRTGYETRNTVLGHIQRGGAPTVFDRVLGTRFGVLAAELAHQGISGRMVALQGNKVIDIDIMEMSDKLKTLDLDLYKVAEVFLD
jgi:6-phosphofructokinase 1